jgi:hypothetical protein
MIYAGMSVALGEEVEEEVMGDMAAFGICMICMVWKIRH